MTPTERNLIAQLDAANIQIRLLEHDVQELRDAIDIKTDEIERVRVILGPTAGRRTEAEQRVLDACRQAVTRVAWMGRAVLQLTEGSQQQIADAVVAWRESGEKQSEQ